MPATLNTNQRRVYAWLNNDLALPVFAEAYKGAVVLLRQKSAGHVSFVAHVGRDLMNALARAVTGITAGRVQYEQLVDKLQNDWKPEWGLSDELSSEVTAREHPIPVEVCRKISTLIEAHISGRNRSSQADALFFSTFLRYSDRSRIPKNFLFEWASARAWFLSHAHLREKPFDTDTANELVKHFNCLDSYLHIAASSQFVRLKNLNEILDETNR